MRKMSFIVILCCLASMASAQLLYKISGNGLSQPSYIVGTYHLAPISMIDSIQGLHDALASCQQVYGELDMPIDDSMSNEVMAKMAAAMRMPGNETLRGLLDEQHYHGIDSLLTSLTGMGLAMIDMAHLSPAAVYTMLEGFITLQLFPNYDPDAQMDNYFHQYAKSKGLPSKGLETVDDQIAVLYHGNSLERQAQLLTCLYDHLDFEKTMIRDLVNAYFMQDLVRMEAAMDMKTNTICDSTPEEEDKLVYQRNQHWMAQISTIMEEKPTFFAVGAAHLIGEKGLLQMLRQEGYTVEGV